MVRKRGSMASCRARARARANQKGKGVIGEGDEPKSQQLCLLANLPSSIITDRIMLQLPIKTLAICRLVCKTWNALISDPYFARLHLSRAPPSVMIRTNDDGRVSRTIYLLELQMFESIIQTNGYDQGELVQHLFAPGLGWYERNPNNRAKLGPAFKLPLRNVELPTKNQRRRHNSYRRRGDDKFGVVNSCYGLLCLHGPCKRDLVICNPVTGEFIKLPNAVGTKNTLGRVYEVGFGFQPKTNEYKVVRIWETYVTRERSLLVQIHTLGKPGWRNVDVDNEFLTEIKYLDFPTYVNGALHWISFDGRKNSILCFDFESERFQFFPCPPHEIFDIHRSSFSMTELGGFLYVFGASSHNSSTMWVMKRYGVRGSWTKIKCLDKNLLPYGLCLPVKHVEKGATILMQHDNRFAYYEPEKNRYKLLEVVGTRSKSFEVIPHIPSLISLKNVVEGDNVEVLNVHSWCAKFKLYEENEVLFLSDTPYVPDVWYF